MLSDALHIDQGIRGIMWHLHNLSRLEEQLPDNAALVMSRRAVQPGDAPTTGAGTDR